MPGSLSCSSCGEVWGIHNPDRLLGVAGRDCVTIAHRRKINHEMMCTGCSKDHYFTAVFTEGYMHHSLDLKQ